MSSPYDFRQRTAYWDPSVLGLTLQVWAGMNSEERLAFLRDALHRAADLAHATVGAFREDLHHGDARAVAQASKVLQSIARKV